MGDRHVYRGHGRHRCSHPRGHLVVVLRSSGLRPLFGDAWLVTVLTDAGGARSNGSSASVGRTTHHTSSYIGSWACPGEFRGLSGSSKPSVGDVPDRSRGRPDFFDLFRWARCHFSPPTGAGPVLSASRTWPFSAIQKVWCRRWEYRSISKRHPLGMESFRLSTLDEAHLHPSMCGGSLKARSAPGLCEVRGASLSAPRFPPSSDGPTRSGRSTRCSRRAGGCPL